jgi:hypothetical protein
MAFWLVVFSVLGRLLEVGNEKEGDSLGLFEFQGIRLFPVIRFSLGKWGGFHLVIGVVFTW